MPYQKLLEVGDIIRDTDKEIEYTYKVTEICDKGRPGQPQYVYTLVRGDGMDTLWLDAAGLAHFFGGNGRE